MQTQQCISKVVAYIKLLFGVNNYVRVRMKNRKNVSFSFFMNTIQDAYRNGESISVLTVAERLKKAEIQRVAM